MASPKHRALVVDDELAIVGLVCRELHSEGFECETAMDGEEALQMIMAGRYDVVVTDLKMPNMHGHALANEILRRRDRPAVIVYTGVIEPRLAKNLLQLGVEDIVFKPTGIDFLAAKIRAVVDRRRQWAEQSAENARQEHQAAGDSEPVEDPAGPVSFERLNRKVSQMSRLLPISKATLDVYEMTREGEWSQQQIAAAIHRDACLTAEVLRLVNCSLYNPAVRRIVDLDEAVLRLGQRRIGELALTASALSALAPAVLPWMDLELAWKRSMASGIIMESLVELGGHQQVEEGLFLCAILNPLGRVVLGMMFPKQYEAMVERCRRTGESLQQQERRVFPIGHTEMVSQLFAAWRISTEAVLPLKFALDDYSTISGLSEPMRTRSELVKLAISLGRLAVNRWETWDLVQLPPASVLKRLGIRSAVEIVRQARSDVNKLAQFRPGKPPAAKEAATSAPAGTVAYGNFSGESDDLLAELLPAMGLIPKEQPLHELRRQEVVWIANCLGTAPAQFSADYIGPNTLVITDQEHLDVFASLAMSVALPNCYGRLSSAVLQHLPQPTLGASGNGVKPWMPTPNSLLRKQPV